jgi:hypothetical protein
MEPLLVRKAYLQVLKNTRRAGWDAYRVETGKHPSKYVLSGTSQII